MHKNNSILDKKILHLSKNYIIIAFIFISLFLISNTSFAQDTTPLRHKETLAPSEASVFPHLSDLASSFDDYDDPIITIADPIEPWNRFWFGFNDIFFQYMARPAYKGYEAVTPSELRLGLKNFLANILFPIRFVNSLLQGKGQAAGVEFGRFMINTTVGLGGLIDVSKGLKTVVPVDPAGEDFGKTLATWGFGSGFYLVVPFIGPSSLRDSIGLAVDATINPAYYIIQPTYIPVLANVGLRFNTIGDILTIYDDLNLFSIDPYIAARSAYATYRTVRIERSAE